MKLPRVRFTVRRLMAAVAVIAAILYAYRSLDEFLYDDPYHSFSSVKRDWSSGPAPSITVDLFEGGITVVPGPDGAITADIFTCSSTKCSQAAADEAHEAIKLGLHQWGDSLRITARGISQAGLRNTIGVTLSVPRGAHLDLRTGRGNICVGRDYVNGKWVSRPVSAASIRARNASDFMNCEVEGSIQVEALAPPRAPGEPPTPTRLELDGPGRIEVIAELALIQARAWHGDPTQVAWAPGSSYESEDEGRIRFEGTLATGSHSLRAAHRITIKVPKTCPLLVDAEAIGGDITGDLLPGRVGPTKGTAHWAGPIGSGEAAAIRLRTDDGPIVLLSKP